MPFDISFDELAKLPEKPIKKGFDVSFEELEKMPDVPPKGAEFRAVTPPMVKPNIYWGNEPPEINEKTLLPGLDFGAFSRAADKIRKREQFRAEAYDVEPGETRKRTIGYGTRDTGLMKITEPEARVLMERVLHNITRQFLKQYGTADFIQLPEKQQIALLSAAYNIGPGLAKSRAVEALKRRDFPTFRKEFRQFNKSNGKVMKELVDRREDELLAFADEY